MSGELPHDWEEVYLNDVAEIFNGKTPSNKEKRNFGHPVLKIKDIDEYGYFVGKFDSFVDDNFFNKYKKKKLKNGDTIILNAAHSSTHVGSKKAHVDFIDKDTIPTGEWTVIRSKNNCFDNRFKHYLLMSPKWSIMIFQLIRGIHLYPKDLANLKILLPPIETQRKIVHILEKAEQLKQWRKEADELTDDYLKSVFLEMFGDSLTNSKSWEIMNLPQLVINDKNAIKRGPFGGSIKKDIFVKEGYLVYEQTHAIHNDFSFARYYITKEKYAEMEMFKVTPGDLIISCSGVTLGRIAEIPNGAKPGIINQALLKVSLNKK